MNEINTSSFSVAMCVYGKDHPAWFREAVDSLLAQTAIPSEIVLVVDGEVPPSLENEIVWCEQNPIFHVVRLPKNVGHGNARRIGLETCQYELVALMDADDIALPDRFEKQLKVFAQYPHLSIVGGNIDEFIKSPQMCVGRRIVPEQHEEIVRYMKKRCPFNQMTVMFRRSHVQQAGGYLDWYNNEDYYLWIRMYLNDMRFANISDTLVYARVGKEMYQRRGGWKYFCSEAKLQCYMLHNRVIGLYTFAINVAKRFILQVAMPNTLRGWVFQKFART